jgi:phosphoribosylanthranilate isomerase
LTRPADAEAAANFGADAVGLVFYTASARHVDIASAGSIAAAVPPFVTVVGLFVDETADRVTEILNRVRIDLLQFHGDEPPGYCEQFGRPYIKAFRVKPGLDLAVALDSYPHANGFLLDAWHPSEQGGTGCQFDWSVIPQGSTRPIVLAGGLNPDNVAGALGTVRPYAVDVSSGVEATKGVKDYSKIQAFLNEVQKFDHKLRGG